MPNIAGRTTERDMSVAVLRYLEHQPFGEATHEELRTVMPHYVSLTEGDLEDSPTRPGEQRWEQIVRNIQSHKNSPNNFIRLEYLEHVSGGGLRITAKGRAFLADLDAS